jgi:DNA-binding NarL/FixJ family response regulator
VTKLNVVLADDHAVLREGLKALLEAQADIEVVGLAYNGAVALTLTSELKPSVLVLDVSMPGMDGSEVAQQVRQLHPTVKMVALSGHEDRGNFHRMLSAGVSGYVLKRSGTDELVRAIRVVAGGGTYIDPLIAGSVFKTSAMEVVKCGLSEREEEVVRQIALGFSNKEIAAQLHLSVKTIETYKARSLDKLGLYSRVNLVRYAIQRGWLNDD